MGSWILSNDHTKFDLAALYHEATIIYWRLTSAKMRINDIVFIYVTEPIGRIMYQFRVVNIVCNQEYPTLQKSFWADRTEVEHYRGDFAIFQKMAQVDSTTMTRTTLKKLGLIDKNYTFQGSLSDKNEKYKSLFDYLYSEFDSQPDEIYPEEYFPTRLQFPESGKTTIQVNRYERSPEARSACIALHGTRCKVCAMSFEETYGTFAKDFIHVHHIIPLSINETYEVDAARDLIPVCPNCHAMLHRSVNGEHLSIERLKQFYEASKNNKKQ